MKSIHASLNILVGVPANLVLRSRFVYKVESGHRLFLFLSAYTQPQPSLELPERVAISCPCFISANSRDRAIHFC